RLGLAQTLQATGDVYRMQNHYDDARQHYEQALALGREIGDFPSQLNSLMGLAFSAKEQGDKAGACDYFQQLFALADSHPFFKTHPLVQKWREVAAELGC
ncbi:MAG: tetratricopeptide repeat protein, partial [Chloroflexi bacterium]